MTRLTQDQVVASYRQMAAEADANAERQSFPSNRRALKKIAADHRRTADRIETRGLGR